VTDTAIVLRKLTVLREHAHRVAQRRPSDAEAYARDIDCQDATAMSLFVAIQESVDIAMHIAADDGFGIPGSYGDAFQLLAANGVIRLELAQTLAGMAGLRNRIANGYASVDPVRLWSEIPAGLRALSAFAQAIAVHVGK
jgi:uncharacterized protein YutE (UPF0331/DUF86 family)